MGEVDVILKVHKALRDQLLGDHHVARLYTDAHSTLLGNNGLRPFQRFVLDFGDSVMHPDLVGQLDDGETLFAVEAKGNSDLLRGLAQAEMYQSGFHLSFLAADSGALGTSLVQFAKRKNIGVIAVADRVEIVHFPVAGMPVRDIFRAIEKQFDSTIQVASDQTFHYNIPTHYLVWAIGLRPNVVYALDEVVREISDYPFQNSGVQLYKVRGNLD